jgi:hypothetical protein
MFTVDTIIRKNSIVQRLIGGGKITREQLKKIYRTLSKLTHPDLKHEDDRQFIRLHEEYEEALAHWDALRTRLAGEDGSTIDIRTLFYGSLRHYLAAGLYSQRVRLRPDIKKRNEMVMREVLSWARLYNPAFMTVFLDFNKSHLRRYLEWSKRDALARARKIFIMGFRNAVDYQYSCNAQSLRTADSFFTDCLRLLETIAPSAASRALAGLARWFREELAVLGAVGKSGTARSKEAP